MNISETNSTTVANINQDDIFLDSCIINLILSVPTNGYVLWLIVNEEGGTVTSEFFALNLAVSEILFCLFSVFYIVSKQSQITAFILIGNFGMNYMNTGRPLFLSCICVERYLAVVHPVTFLKYKPLRYRVGCCAAAWMLVLGTCFFSMFLIGTSIYTYAYLVQCLILSSVMLFCCLSVLRALKQPRPGEVDREGAKNTKTRAFKIISFIFVTKLLNNSVLVISTSIAISGLPVKTESLRPISFSINVISGFVYPLLYLHRAGKLPCIKAF